MVIGALTAVTVLAAIAMPATIPDIVAVTDIAGLALSPDGRLVAFRTEQPSVASNRTRIEWYVVPVDGSAPARPVGDGGDALLNQAGAIASERPVWSPRSNAIYYRALVDGMVQVWRGAVDGSGSRPATSDAADVRDVALSSDRHSLHYHVGASRDAILTAERKAHDEGVLIDKSVDMNQPLTSGGFINGRLGSQRFTGTWFDRDNILWQTPERETDVDLDPADVNPDLRTVKTEQQLSSVIPTIETDHGQDFATVTINGRKIHCSVGDCRLKRPVAIVSLGSQNSYIVTFDDDALNQTVAAWNPQDQTLRTIVTAHGLLSGGRRRDAPCETTPDALLCVASSASEPPKLVRIATRDGKIDPLFDPNEPLRQRAAGLSGELHWQDHQGVAFSGQLFLPRTQKPAGGYPLVISYYRCEGFLRGGVGDELPLIPLAAAGIAALCINSPPSNDATQMPEHDYALALSGISSVLEKLAGDGITDRHRIGYWGLSFGSEVGFRLATGTRLASAISIGSGSVDPIAWWMNGVAGRDFPETVEKVWHAGDPDQDPQGWQRISAALNVTSMVAPMLVQAPEQEARFSMELLSDATRAARPIEMWAFPDEGHIKSEPRHKLSVYVRNFDWFRYWLQDYEDPLPDKRDQYLRWAVLRQQRDALEAPDRVHP